MKSNNDNLIIFGKNPVKEALKTQNLKSIYVSGRSFDDEIVSLAEREGVEIHTVQDGDLKNLSKSDNHQGVVGILKPFNYSSLEEIILKSKKRAHPLILMLDEINDPQNFGAILRSCDAFGVDGVIVKKTNQVPITSTVMKTSAGAANFVKVARVSNLGQAILELKKNGYWIVSADGSGQTDYTSLKYDFPTVLIIGNEGSGISPLILSRSDYIVRIPMLGSVNSLNASVATGVLLAHIRTS
ncbi:MAG: 23S rRNA (guanosine(2251)-2'-O)-methyltransferase RlmB [Coprobacillus sp.]|nr:23S rRNA (guanosine(2251)-2'-O)-methyltransferase RlmB [Coprobacillus sp.]